MSDLMKAAEAWARLPAELRAELLHGMEREAATAGWSPLRVQQRWARANEAAAALLVAAAKAVEKEKAQRTQPIAELVTDLVVVPATTWPPSDAPEATVDAPPMRALSDETTDEHPIAGLKERSTACDRSRDSTIIECARCGFADCREVQP